jgi:hypothetical protein
MITMVSNGNKKINVWFWLIMFKLLMPFLIPCYMFWLEVACRSEEGAKSQNCSKCCEVANLKNHGEQ